MSSFSIAVLPGDGIGPEVIDAVIPLAEQAATLDKTRFEWTHYPWNSEYYRNNGRMAPEDFVEQLRHHNAILLGAIGHPDIPDHVTLNGLLLPIRRKFDQCICIRPSYLYEGITSPLRDKNGGDIDILVFRENTEGEYAQIGGRLYNATDHDVAIQTSLYTRRGCTRIIQAAFEASRKRKQKVSSITKSNAQGFGMVLWDDVFKNVSKSYPDIETESVLIDRACMDFVRRPETFDVVVASNLFGDILTDLGAILVGSLGLAPSANITLDPDFPSMFEPVHGSAPDITGQNIANPIATVLSVAMMMDHLGLKNGAQALDASVKELLRTHGPRTPDIGGTSKTQEVAAALSDLVTQHS